MSTKDEQDMDRNAALANLTDEERAALAEDVSPEETAALEAIAGDEDANDASDGDGDESDASAAAKPAPAAEAKPAAAKPDSPPAAKAADADEDNEPEFRPTFKASLPEDFDAQVTALDDREKDLAAKFKAGEMDADKFIVETRDITSKRSDLNGMRTQASTFESMNAQTARQEWEWTVSKFMRTVKKAEGIDYLGDADKGADFDQFVKVLATKPGNESKDYDWFLAEAHKRTKALHGIADKAAPTDKKSGDKPGDKPASRKPDVSKLPGSLANVPGGDGPGDVGDEFADIDKLSGLEYEMAMAKMSPAQRERFLLAA